MLPNRARTGRATVHSTFCWNNHLWLFFALLVNCILQPCYSKYSPRTSTRQNHLATFEMQNLHSKPMESGSACQQDSQLICMDIKIREALIYRTSFLYINTFFLFCNCGTHCKGNQQKSHTVLRYILVEIMLLHKTRFTKTN